VSGSTVTKYYYAGSSRVAMRSGSTLYYLLTDHLGSTSITTSATGTKVAELRYKAWGEVRYTSGTTPTKYQFTGQYSNVSEFGLLFYQSRWLDPSLGRFSSADTIVSGGVQGLDRYAYANNSPMVYSDPSGHWGETRQGSFGTYLHLVLTVNLASSGIPRGVLGAQLTYSPNLGVPSYIGNLCGDISLSALYETVTGQKDTLGYIYQMGVAHGRSATGGTSAKQFADQAAFSFGQGWTVTAYYYNYTYQPNLSDWTNPTRTVVDKSLTQITETEFQARVTGMVCSGSAVYLGVAQDTVSGQLTAQERLASKAPNVAGHWVLVTGIDQYGVDLYNSYWNGPQRYTWQDLYNSFGYYMVKITPPTPLPLTVTYRHDSV
jgi:RHS repeat-associated protein